MSEFISIITPTYNRGYILPNAIRSVLEQTLPSWEMIIVDDGSTDDTERVVKGFKDERIRYEKLDRNRGQTAARNHGLDIARGDWITFLDSDDEFYPRLLAQCMHVVREHADALCIIPKGKKTHELWKDNRLVQSAEVTDAFPEHTENVVKDIFMRRFIFAITGFVHDSSIRDEGIRFDASLDRMEDWDYALTIGEKHPNAFFYLAETLYNYHQRYGEGGLCSNTPYNEWAYSFERIYQKHKDDKMLEGQEWYPNRVEKWLKIQKEFEAGHAPPPDLYFFQQ